MAARSDEPKPEEARATFGGCFGVDRRGPALPRPALEQPPGSWRSMDGEGRARRTCRCSRR
eukprot:scaffold19593_cov82-Isochrysis_galbana.AAC.1